MWERLLFETRAGDRFLCLLERLTGLAIVPVAWLDGRVAATAKGRAAAKERASRLAP